MQLLNNLAVVNDMLPVVRHMKDSSVNGHNTVIVAVPIIQGV